MGHFAECDRALLLRKTAARFIGGQSTARCRHGPSLRGFLLPTKARHSHDPTLKDTVLLSL